MHQYFRRAETFRRFHEGPLGPFIDLFGEWLHRRGYRRYPGRAAIRSAAKFSRWLAERGAAIDEVSQDSVGRYCKNRSRAERVSIRQIMAISRPEIFAVKPTPAMDTPLNRFLTEFAFHVKVERGLAPGSIKYLLRFGAVFLREMFPDARLNWQSLDLADIVKFFQSHVCRGWAVQMHQIVAAVRSLLRFVHFHGEIAQDLSVSVPRVPHWSKAALPKYLSSAEVRKALESCDRQMALGKRNYAILLLLARFGLRAGEVASLQLESIDWDSAVMVVRGKGSRCSEFPLLKDVGEALADYLQNGRPETSARTIFLRAVAPVQALHGQAAIGSIVRSVLKRAGIYHPRRTAHAFRHTLATQMLRDGVSLQEIGHILRHQNPDTTTIYAKVDLNALRELAVAWPGGAR